MSSQSEEPNVFTYLDRITGSEGIKTSNQIDVAIDGKTAVTLFGIGIGLVVFSHLLGVGLRKLIS